MSDRRLIVPEGWQRQFVRRSPVVRMIFDRCLPVVADLFGRGREPDDTVLTWALTFAETASSVIIPPAQRGRGRKRRLQHRERMADCAAAMWFAAKGVAPGRSRKPAGGPIFGHYPLFLARLFAGGAYWPPSEDEILRSIKEFRGQFPPGQLPLPRRGRPPSRRKI